MNRTTIAGVALAALSLTLLAAESLTGFVLSDAVAMGLCRDDHPRETNGVLADGACGFDTDMRLVALYALGVVGGVITSVARAARDATRHARQRRAAAS